MKEISSAFLSHLQSSDKRTICNCIAITSNLTTDIYYFTDCYKDLAVDGNTYLSDGRFTISATKKSLGNQVDTLTVTQIVEPSGSNFNEIAKKKLLEGSQVDVYLVNRVDTTQFYQDFKGYISRVKVRDFTVDIEVEGTASRLLQNIMKTYEHSCIVNFGSAECGFNTATVTETGTITSVTNRRKFIDTSRSESDDHFQFGIFTFTSGDNNGLTREVKTYDSITKEFVLYSDMPYEIVVGTTYSVYEGCDKLPDTCKDDFDNFINFRGYLNLVPNADKLTWTPPDEYSEEG